jgi:Tol biopolymer transport system component
MAIAAGTHFGPYRILSPLGAGGMGEVYRAVDTRLDRTVAVKVLPRELSSDPSRRQRFDREARALSSLNHQHICALHDVGEHDGVLFLVMEFVDGQSLADRLLAGPLPSDQLLKLAAEMADALDHAHRQGLVHRDLKPANIMLTKSGAKVLDFGIARLVAPDAGVTSSRADTLTEEGSIIGTPQYMAPEQLEGRGGDARSDIFAFGAVLFEMATGCPAFAGASPVNVISAILKSEPPAVSAARSPDQAPLPPLVDDVVARCLAKDPQDRWQTASDLRHALGWIAGGATSGTRSAPRGAAARWTWRRRAVVAAFGLVVITVAIGLTRVARRTENAAPTARFTVEPPDGASFNPSAIVVAVSPDGRWLALSASSRTGGRSLWLRPIDAVEARQLAGTDGASQMFWSADGQQIAFVSGSGILQRVDIASGVVQTVGEGPRLAGSWGADGTILFRHRDPNSIFRMKAEGGDQQPVTALDPARRETSHAWPQWLPDGRHFLFLALSSEAQYDSIVYVGSIDSPERIEVTRADSHAVYSSGHLLFVRGGSLVSQPFDVRTYRLTGDPVVAAQQVETGPSLHGAFSVSETGVLAYRGIGRTQLRWFDRSGRPGGVLDAPAHDLDPALSPDEQRLAFSRADPENGRERDIWTIDLSRGIATRVTFHADAAKPIWSPDGKELVFVARGITFARAASDGSGGQPQALATARRVFDQPLEWLPDGRVVLYQDGNIWMRSIDGQAEPTPIAPTEYAQIQGRIAPDGKWLAFASNESGRYEVYVRPFPAGSGKWRVSADGGVEPAWRGDGRELFFLAPDRELMAAPIATQPQFTVGRPERLFQTRMSTVVNTAMVRNQYVVTRDGSRFLINEPVGEAPPITVVLNWPASITR